MTRSALGFNVGTQVVLLNDKGTPIIPRPGLIIDRATIESSDKWLYLVEIQTQLSKERNRNITYWWEENRLKEWVQ